MSNYYAEHSKELRRELGRELPTDVLRALHQRRPRLHFLVVCGLVAALGGSVAMIVALDRWYFWLPFAVVAGFALFNFTVLLHEVVHKTVLTEQKEAINRLLGFAYAIPSGISSSQFTRWHLDHHAELGSDLDDPKRHHLSPKINARWLKLLYFTPALFFIYFRAAKRESATYAPELQRTIRLERNLTMTFHVTLLALLWFVFGGEIAWKAYVVPYFLIFPIAFALNRVGQHYDIDPSDPAKWATMVKGSWFWDIAYLCSNYHLEHHYFPSVPLYNLPKLQRTLLPFYERHGFTPRSYGGLFWNYVVLNKRPHSNWAETAAQSGTAVAES